MPNAKIEIENFVEKYLKLKNKYMSDGEIAREMLVSQTTLRNLKKEHDIAGMKRPRSTVAPISEDELRRGEANGLSRELILKRVRERFWRVERAITEPRGGKRK